MKIYILSRRAYEQRRRIGKGIKKRVCSSGVRRRNLRIKNALLYGSDVYNYVQIIYVGGSKSPRNCILFFYKYNLNLNVLGLFQNIVLGRRAHLLQLLETSLTSFIWYGPEIRYRIEFNVFKLSQNVHPSVEVLDSEIARRLTANTGLVVLWALFFFYQLKIAALRMMNGTAHF